MNRSMEKIKLHEVKLPSNRKFGIFFTVIFCAISTYLYLKDIKLLLYLLFPLTIILFFITIIKAELLMPFNKLWLKFGLMLSKIVSPIVLGMIFFAIFTPIAIFFRIIGRDELKLGYKRKFSYWIERETSSQSEPFKNQF